LSGHIQDSSKIDWCTPPHIIQAVEYAFGGRAIGLDPCYNPDGFTRPQSRFQLEHGQNGLTSPWETETVFVNPPYGTSYVELGTNLCYSVKEAQDRLAEYPGAVLTKQSIKDWIKKCESTLRERNLAQKPCQIVALIPASVDTSTWQSHIFKTARAVCFLKGRVKFWAKDSSGKMAEGGPSPMGCAIVLWTNTDNFVPNHFKAAFRNLGEIVSLNYYQPY
jgi:hypothetical protein